MTERKATASAGDEGEVLEGDFGAGEGSFVGVPEDDGDFVEMAELGGGDVEVEGLVYWSAYEREVGGEAGDEGLLA
jgi:hypothetical protein